MAKTKISQYDSTAANNLDINSINIAEGMAPSDVNNAIRELMAELKNFQTGAGGDDVTVGGNLTLSSTLTANASVGTAGNVLLSRGAGLSPQWGASTVYAASGSNNDITSLLALSSVPTVIVTAIAASFPAGTIIDFAGSTPPTGYILCDGSSLLRAGTYANLFAAIGVLWGSVDGTHFNVPNFAAGEAAVQNAGTVGASTVGELLTHSHATNSGVVSGGGGTLLGGSGVGLGNATASTMTPSGGTKNKAAGQYVLKCIKY